MYRSRSLDVTNYILYTIFLEIRKNSKLLFHTILIISLLTFHLIHLIVDVSFHIPEQNIALIINLKNL